MDSKSNPFSNILPEMKGHYCCAMMWDAITFDSWQKAYGEMQFLGCLMILLRLIRSRKCIKIYSWEVFIEFYVV